MTIVPLTPLDALEAALTRAQITEAARRYACPVCTTDYTACPVCAAASSAVFTALLRRDAARSQHPARHITTGGAMRRRYERDLQQRLDAA